MSKFIVVLMMVSLIVFAVCKTTQHVSTIVSRTASPDPVYKYRYEVEDWDKAKWYLFSNDEFKNGTVIRKTVVKIEVVK